MKRTLARLVWWILSSAARRPRFRPGLVRFISRAQEELGVGSGAPIDTSGEVVSLWLLKSEQPFGRGLCVFDVGSNQGQYLSLAISELAGFDHEVHCFEPSRATFELLEQKFGGRANIHLNQFGLGSENGDFNLYSDMDGSGLASLTRRRLDHVGIRHDHTERVSITTLDEYCVEHEIALIDLLKIDVEGHELDVLRGSTAMLRGRKIRMVTFEFGGCNIDTRTYVRDFWYLLQDLGMVSLHRMMPSGRLFRIDAYSESIEAFRTTNFLAVFDASLETRSFE